MDFDFDKLTYHYYAPPKKPFELTELIGFDSESYDDGKPFLFCTSKGESYAPSNLLSGIFSSPHDRVDYCVWNLRYDAGSVLSLLPLKALRELWKTGCVEWAGYVVEYIPHKLLRFRLGKRVRNFWDIMPFFKSSLESAARQYLGEGKDELETKKFSRAYVRKKLAKIRAYCIKDCVLTARLGTFLLRYLHKFDVHPRALYSTASISLEYFINKTEYVDVLRFWRKHRDILRAACASYAGGKFEVIARGRFRGYEYDISSAYGSELADLLDLRYARVVYENRYRRDCAYGFIEGIIDNRKGHPVPCCIKRGNLNLHPAGVYRTWMTKQEYDFFRRHKIPVKIVKGLWLKFSREHRPYRKEIIKLYKLKEKYKTRDKFKSAMAKLMVNSLYGKFLQVVEQEDGTLEAGKGWNPIYGAIITANMRIRLTEMQVKLGRHCLAVHTDSIVTDRKMPDDFCGDKLGDWTLKYSGDGVIIACGIFQVGPKNANRGYILEGGHSWLELLEKHGRRSTVDMTETRPLSWTNQVHRGTKEDINYFETVTKTMSLNCERKRVWLKPTNAARLLRGLEFSHPPVHMEK